MFLCHIALLLTGCTNHDWCQKVLHHLGSHTDAGGRGSSGPVSCHQTLSLALARVQWTATYRYRYSIYRYW